jgi:hypothetical protein
MSGEALVSPRRPGHPVRAVRAPALEGFSPMPEIAEARALMALLP